MKASNVSSAATPNAAATAATASSARKRSSPPSLEARPSHHADAIAAGGFALAGPSDLPDPATNAYRQDLADIALAGRVIASHYAEPLLRHLAQDAPLLASRHDGGETVAQLKAGAKLHMLDCSLGWAWGYTADDHLVGYVRFEALKS